MSQQIYQLVTDRILALLQKGVVPWKKPWKTSGGSALPRNLVSGRPYRGINVFLLIAQSFGSPYWLTFKQALKLDGHVRRGERGTPIVFWRIDQNTSEDCDEDESGRGHRRILLRYYTLFNVGQCEGIEVPGAEEIGPCFDPIPACEAVYAAMPNPPELRHGGERAFYRRDEDLVQLPKPETFSSREHYYSTQFHELAHATGHRSRLNRFEELANSGGFGSPSYAREELVAEMTAAMICGMLGIDPVKVEAISSVGGEELLECSAAYLQHWIGVLQDDSRALVIAAARAQKAADYILRRQQGDEALERNEAA
jgi:antirestriction protein ArdC